MPNTYSQIYLQFVFAVKHRQSLVSKQHKEELQKYISGMVPNRDCKMLAISCMPDHTHMFVGLKPIVYIHDFMKEIKVASNGFVNEKRWLPGNFEWQDGYGVFSYSHSDIDRVIKYVNNQEEHHKRRSFREEYVDFLVKFQVPYEEQYLFTFFD